ncbi:hypothetical protein SS49_05735 [Enterobacter hormaechei subsp. steigerwaltii]|nr:hypothetical protein SS49_05735 [Enterobacter hormaechei subsp. steigerwaltii]
MVIVAAAATVPVGQENQRAGIRHIRLQLPDMTGLLHIGFDIRAVLLTVLRETFHSVLKPRAFGDVFRMVLQDASTQVTGIAVVRGGLCSTGTGQTTISVESDIEVA